MLERRLPFVTIAIPCLNEELYIEQCLDDVFAQTYPAGAFEVIVADGRSADGTRAVLTRLARERQGQLRVLDNPQRRQASAMNRILEAARGEVIVRMDVHARYAPNYVASCVEVLGETGAENVGGAQRPIAKSWLQRVFCAAFDSPLAVGGARYRNAEAEGFVDTVFLGAFRTETLKRMGGYDEGAVTNEDAELNQRLVASGGRVYLSRKIVCSYYPRDSFAGLARQYFRYGMGRARTLLKHGRLPNLRPAMPFLVLITCAGMMSVRPLAPAFFYALCLYIAILGVEALRVCLRPSRTLALAPAVAAVFPVLHLAHGLGFGVGLLCGAVTRVLKARTHTA